MIELDKAHSAFGQTTREQTIRCKGAIPRLGAVHVEDVLGFIRDIHQARHRGLHLERHLVLRNAGRDLRIVNFAVVNLIQSVHGINHRALVVAGDSLRIAHVEHRITFGMEGDTLEPARKEPAVPLPGRDGLALATSHRRENHVARQVIGLCSQPVEKPGSHTRAPGNLRARIHKGVGRIVIDLLRHQRPHDRDLVRHLANAREDGTDMLSALPKVLELVLWSQALQVIPATLQLRDGLTLGNRLGHGLAVHLRKLGLVIEGLEVGGPARHAQVNDPLGPGKKVRLLDHTGPFLGFSGTGFLQDRRERKSTDPCRRLVEEGAAVQIIGNVHGVRGSEFGLQRPTAA